jgi:hypothetical protein
MLVNFLLWYMIGSYIVGAVLFVVELIRNLDYRHQHPGDISLAQLIMFGVVLFVLSPITAWHGVLHYAQTAYCRLTNRPVKFWI